MDNFKVQVKKEHYIRRKYNNLNRFISYFYQVDLVSELASSTSSILEIGVGNKTVSHYLKNMGLNVTTVDIDEGLKPDYKADIRKLPFVDKSFDIVLAYEILEHIPFEEFPKALSELSRVGKENIIVSLPYRSSGFELVLKFPFIRTILKKQFFNILFRIPLRFGGIKTSGQHYWEIDSKKYSLKKVRGILSQKFKIIKEARPVLNHFHYFFVLKNK